MKNINISLLVVFSLVFTLFANDNKYEKSFLKNLIVSELGERENLNRYYSEMDKSELGLNEYKEKILYIHENIDKTNLKDFHCTITFTEAVELKEAFKLAKDYKIKPKLIYAFAESNENDEIITIGCYFKGKNPQETITSTLEHFKKNKKNKFLGVVSLIGTVSKEKIKKLQNNSKIFLVDISADEKLTINPGNKKYMHHFSWNIYHNKK